MGKYTYKVHTLARDGDDGGAGADRRLDAPGAPSYIVNDGITNHSTTPRPTVETQALFDFTDGPTEAARVGLVLILPGGIASVHLTIAQAIEVNAMIGETIREAEQITARRNRRQRWGSPSVAKLREASTLLAGITDEQIGRATQVARAGIARVLDELDAGLL